jgi:hypothetical protein
MTSDGNEVVQQVDKLTEQEKSHLRKTIHEWMAVNEPGNRGIGLES